MSVMKKRGIIIGALLVLIGLPPTVAVTEAVRFFVANRSNGSFVSSAETRDYLLYVPGSYDRTKPTALVISLHGATMWGAAQKEMSQWNRVADANGFIVVYPSGAKGNGPRVWHEGDGTRVSNDVRFISELIDTLRAHYNIDQARVYANGLSNGGGMSFALSCMLPDRIAAVGLVAPALFLPWSACANERPVPMMIFFGTADPALPYHGGTSWVAPGKTTRFPDIPRWTATWARRNRCAPTPVDFAVASDVSRRSYTGCANDAHVVLYTIEGGGHTWPGGGPVPEWFAGRTATSIDASSVMWEFFREHPLRHAQEGVKP